MGITRTSSASGTGTTGTFEEVLDFLLNVQAQLPEGVDYADVEVKIESWRGDGNDSWGSRGPGWKLSVTW
ncbi:hypothetical protein SEA_PAULODIABOLI_336 [Microbacterium phage PauloDiaboli]|nr:hypothetical protein SEA_PAULODIABOLI_336 [Microbacterium phage PauloDiaboli]QWY84143.1 hypothetical protein SEA_A3WALLY_336 [Microbacterium phage A3Wally]